MLPRLQSPLDELLMGRRADDDELDLAVGKELLGRPVVLGGGEVDGAVAPARGVGGAVRVRGGGSLQEGVHVQLRVRQDEGQVEALCGEAVADDAYLDWGRHGSGIACSGAVVVRPMGCSAGMFRKVES